MVHWAIYFAGPKSRWSGRIDPSETLAQGQAPWRWLARWAMFATWRSLDPRVCGYALLHEGVCVEQYDPPLPDPPKPVAA